MFLAMLENCFQYDLPEAGCDEAGRGCLAGPVLAAAVMLPPDFHDQMCIRDSDISRIFCTFAGVKNIKIGTRCITTTILPQIILPVRLD